jgi:outer membrane biosynthesis protein TonB
MRMDRAEKIGTGAALLFHVALIGAMSMSLANVNSVPEPPAMEVELVEEVGLTAAAPQQVVVPPPPSQAPEIGEAEPIDAATPPPLPRPTPAPLVKPAPPRPAATPKLSPVVKPTPPRAAPPKPAPRASRIGDDFLKGISDDKLAPRAGPAPKPAAATVSASAMAGIVQAIRRQVQPCADRQVNPGAGASRIKVRMRLQLTRSGRLRGPPQVIGTSGVDDENARYEERVKDLAVATFVGCAPLVGLPPELYETESGRGWSDFIMNYNLP